MTAEVIPLRIRERDGNGAREAMIAAMLRRGIAPEKAGEFTDWFLAEMYMAEFKVVPL